MYEHRAVDAQALEVRGMHKSFPEPDGRGRVTVLSDVSLAVSQSAFVAIVGPSGSGKSTLLHCAAGLETPDSGQVLVAGTDVTRFSHAHRAAYRREHVGVVFQEHNLIGSLTVRDNILLPSRLRGHRLPRFVADQALAHIGLAHRARHRPHQLSGGEQQRVAIARVLVSKPSIVFADEPTGALDVSASSTVLRWLRAICAGGSSVVMVTHDPQAAAIADHVFVMGSGEIRTSLPGGHPERIAEAIVAAQQELAC